MESEAIKNLRRKEAIAEHRRKLANGEIELGPFPDHSKPITDTRDLRDPQIFGMWITENMVREAGSLSQAVDLWADQFERVPPYDPGESMAVVHARAYREELEQRAESGDKFAQSLLKYWDEHGTLQGAKTEPAE